MKRQPSSTISRPLLHTMGSLSSCYIILLLALSSPCLAKTQQPPSSSSNTLRSDFLRAMDEATQRTEESEHQHALMQRLLKAAKPTKTAFTSPHLRRQQAEQERQQTEQEQQRDLGNNYYYQNGDGYYYQNNNDDADDEEEQDDDRYNFDEYYDYGGLNLTEYALKYLGCQNIHTWSDNLASGEYEDDNNEDDYYQSSASGNLAMNRFVVFRLCPKESCSNYNQWGCQYNYGEYMIPMDDYLLLMNSYHLARYAEYCQTCQACMENTGNRQRRQQQQEEPEERKLDNNQYGGGQYYNYNGYGNNNYNGDDYYQANDDGNAANGDDGQYNNANGGDDAYANNDDAAAAQNDDAGGDDDDDAYANNATASAEYSCMYEEVCSGYKDACQDYDADNNDVYSKSNGFSQFFSCSKTYVGNAISYLAPHCRSDGYSLGIGMYADSGCNTYVGDMMDMEQVTGQEAFDDQYLSPYYQKQCISCQASESFDLSGSTGVYEVCGYLYQQAAKCNRAMAEQNLYENTYEQEANEEAVCSFTASLVENNYDEYGEIILEAEDFHLSQWKNVNAYRKDIVSKATPGQIFGLVISISMVIGLAWYANYLRGKIITRTPWVAGKQGGGFFSYFSRPNAAARAGKMSRQHSGITMQRSISGVDPSFSQSESFTY